MILYRNAETTALMGMVKTQAVTMERAVPQRTAFTRLAVPTPIIEEETTWVVLTGIPKLVAVKITSEELRSEANPLIGSSLKILPPIVLIILQPPAAVPAAIAVAQIRTTQKGT